MEEDAGVLAYQDFNLHSSMIFFIPIDQHSQRAEEDDGNWYDLLRVDNREERDGEDCFIGE